MWKDMGKVYCFPSIGLKANGLLSFQCRTSKEDKVLHIGVSTIIDS